MSSRRNDPNVIGVFINRNAVDRGQPVKILRGRRAQLNLGGDVDLAALPALDGNRTCWRSDNCDCAGIPQAVAIVARRSSRQQCRGGRGWFVFLRRYWRMDVKSGE